MRLLANGKVEEKKILCFVLVVSQNIFVKRNSYCVGILQVENETVGKRSDGNPIDNDET